jgi:hypothetical protein
MRALVRETCEVAEAAFSTGRLEKHRSASREVELREYVRMRLREVGFWCSLCLSRRWEVDEERACKRSEEGEEEPR